MRTHLQSETDTEIQILARTVEVVVAAEVPVAVMDEVEPVAPLVAVKDDGELETEVAAEEPLVTLNSGAEAVTHTDAGNRGDIDEPTVTRYPVDAVTHKGAVVAVDKLIGAHTVGQVFLQHGVYFAEIHFDVLVVGM